MFSMMVRGSVAVVAVCLATACGPSTAHPTDRSAGETIPATAGVTGSAPAMKPASPAVPATGGPGYSATLSARLLTTDSLPPGFTVQIATVMARDAGNAGDRRADSGCSDHMIPLLSASRLTGTPSAMAAATLSRDGNPDNSWLWVGTEIIRTYADDGARRAMTDLRTFVGRCPTVASGPGGGSYRFALAPGPGLGDDSLRVSSSSTSGADTLTFDSILVRTGTALIVVKEQGNNPDDDKLLAQVAEAALRRYQATGS
ncbi:MULTISPECIES: hypothetical protein [Micromonospora]|uniref:hypothetical protein n=2 Tax=Micromonospora TaxID=1873 RepID=UPI0031CF23D9